MEDAWLTAAKRLLAIASTGEHFTAHAYDRERYEEVAAIARQLLATLGESTPSVVANLFPQHGKGYATPQIDVRGAVLRGDRILLVQERADNLWTLPGGYAEVGLSPSANVAKEVAEEAGLDVQVSKLYALKHKAAHTYDPDARDFYKFFFLCEDPGGEPRPGLETSDAAFFALEELPPLSTARVIKADLAGAFACRDQADFQLIFD